MRSLILVLSVALASPAFAEAPPALIEATESAARACTALGGTPTILAGYETTHDLNGDGIDDFVTDVSRLECRDAWSAFCGSSGCPVTVWLSDRAAPGPVRFDLGRLQGFEIVAADPLPKLVATYASIYCADSLDSCTRTWVFDSTGPREPPIDQIAKPTAPEPEPEETVAKAPPVAAAPPGWTLRRVPGSSPVALGSGIGGIATFAAFCLENQPFLAVTLHEPPGTADVPLGFAFSEGNVDVTVGYEETAGGAFVVSLAKSDLARRLAGRDTEVAVSLAGKAQGILSLAGSTKALRGALGPCHGF